MDHLIDIAERVYIMLETVAMRHVSSLTFAASAGFALLVLFIDLHRRGYRFSWTRRMVESVGANLAFWWGNLLFAPVVFLSTGFVKQFYMAIGLPHVEETFWAGVPVWVLVPFAVFCHDFANYWNHRAMHCRWLWPVHAIHHSDPHINALTTYRVHFLEPFIMAVSYILLLSWLGFPTDVMGYGAVFLVLHNMYVHINIDWSHGPLRYVIASPRMHQWHHADLPAAYGKNLANLFPVFDLVFGTYYVPGPCGERFGARGVPENDVVKLVLFPFALWGRRGAAALRSVAREKKSGRKLSPSE